MNERQEDVVARCGKYEIRISARNWNVEVQLQSWLTIQARAHGVGLPLSRLARNGATRSTERITKRIIEQF